MTTTARVDDRLTPDVSTAMLVQLWSDHTPAFSPAPATCEGCGHHYTITEPLCPTAKVVRPVLWRRRHQYTLRKLTAALTFNQWRDLSDPIERASTYTRSLTDHTHRPQPARTPVPAVQGDLFDTHPHRAGGAR